MGGDRKKWKWLQLERMVSSSSEKGMIKARWVYTTASVLLGNERKVKIEWQWLNQERVNFSGVRWSNKRWPVHGGHRGFTMLCPMPRLLLQPHLLTWVCDLCHYIGNMAADPPDTPPAFQEGTWRRVKKLHARSGRWLCWLECHPTHQKSEAWLGCVSLSHSSLTFSSSPRNPHLSLYLVDVSSGEV